MGAALSGELIDQIIFAMENQEQSFLFDMEKLEVVPASQFEESGEEPDEQTYVRIPRWTSADGYHLMEKFVAGINNPLYRQDLGQALAGGKGVFRRYKDVLKSHGPLEKLWYTFKEREMRQTVREWFQSSEEARALAALGPEPEETEELVLSDFPITVEHIVQPPGDDLVDVCFRDAFPQEAEALWELFAEECLANLESGEEILRIRASAPEGDFAGVALLARFDTTEGSIYKLPLLYVDLRFRGLGLAKLLVELAAEEAEKRGGRDLLLDLPGEGSVLLPFLEEAGFSTIRRTCRLNLRLR